MKPRRPHQTGPPGLAHNNPRTPNVHISGPRCENTKRGKEERKLWRDEGKKKTRNFGPPTLRGPTLRGPTLRGPTLRGPHPLSSQNSTSKNWPKSKLAEVEIGRSRFDQQITPPSPHRLKRTHQRTPEGFSTRNGQHPRPPSQTPEEMVLTAPVGPPTPCCQPGISSLRHSNGSQFLKQPQPNDTMTSTN